MWVWAVGQPLRTVRCFPETVICWHWTLGGWRTFRMVLTGNGKKTWTQQLTQKLYITTGVGQLNLLNYSCLNSLAHRCHVWCREKQSVCTLCLEGAEVLSEGVCWTLELQKSQVAMFPHLHHLVLLLPHSHYNLTSQTGRQTPKKWID